MWVKNLKSGAMVDLEKVKVIWDRAYEPEGLKAKRVWILMADDIEVFQTHDREEMVEVLKWFHNKFGAESVSSLVWGRK